ncbi:MAG: bacteriocin fulvocin C-related protein [Chitinophagaceae bacterium]|nr:bacteriocin fulvocin C-related protein [Chitinophagaceae bacterium]
MKKYLGFLIASFLIVGASCSKQGNADIETNDLTAQVLQLKTTEAQRITFAEILTPSQKNQVWQSRINKMIKENTLTDIQKGLMLELKQKLNITIFESNSKRDEFMSSFVLDWQKRAIPVIGYDLLFKYLANIDDVQTKESLAARSGCNCNSTSSFSCIGRNECDNPACNSSDSGCGFLWLYECNGRCTLSGGPKTL